MVKQNQLRDHIRDFMEANGLKAHPWARKAGVRSSTLYNLLSGTSESLSAESLSKLAKAAGVTVDQLLGQASQKTIPVEFVVGTHGRVFGMDSAQQKQNIEIPPGLESSVEMVAATIDGDGLFPIPENWVVVFEREPKSPEHLLRKVAVVTVRGKQGMFIRQIANGSKTGLYTLHGWNTAPLEDVEIVAAQRVVAITQAS